MLNIQFEGWFQCRLATNPDPTDERRGISGYTFAVAGEPDLDRLIRFHQPVAPRSHAPRVGVTVTSVAIDNAEVPDHVLLGAAADLLGNPRFESRNVLLGDDKSGVGVIEPFHICVSGGGIVVQRQDVLYPTDPALPLHLLPPPAFIRRSALHPLGMVRDPELVAQATGITDPTVYRAERKKRLEQDLLSETDETKRAGLQKRIRELAIADPRDVRSVFMTAVQSRAFDINGPVVLRGETGRLGITPDNDLDWPIRFWMGGWDADGLCGYVVGVLTIPSRHGAG